MLSGKKLAVILSGIAFCGMWLFFTQKVQDKQLHTHEKSVDLMMSLAEENLTKFFQAPLELEGANVQAPFTFLLTLDAETNEPKFFAKNKNFKAELSALSIKSAFKANKGNKLFVFKSKKISNMPLIVRVFKGGEVNRLEGMPLRNLENALAYAFSDQNWFLADDSNRVLLGSGKVKKRFNPANLENTFIKKPISIGKYKVSIYVKKASGFSVALANIFGLFGIGLITFSILGLFGRESSFEEEAHMDMREEKADSFFDQDFEEDIQMVNLKRSEEAFVDTDKKTEVSVELPDANFKEEQSEKPADVSKAHAKELDYSDFLMENPILGEKLPKPMSDLPKSEPSTIENIIAKAQIQTQVDDTNINFIEDVVATTEQEVAIAESQTDVNLENDMLVQAKEKFEPSSEDDWLKLAEELTESLEEFAQNYDDKIADEITKDLKV